MSAIDLDMDRVNQQIAEGWISKRKHPTADLYIYNYTKRTQYARHWTPETIACRGLILDGNDQVVARGFDKFFNLSETPDTQIDALPDGPIEVTDKADGSLGILYWIGDEPHIATRGSFDGEQAVWATEWLRNHVDLMMLDLVTRAPKGGVTLLFEIIYPANRVVLNYGDRAELVLIGARETVTGRDLGYDHIEAAAGLLGVAIVPRLPHTSIHDLLPLVKTAKGIEGWVVRYPNGLRVKVKCEDYLALHRLVFGLTPERVRDAMLLDFDGFVANLPEELRPEVEQQASKIEDAVTCRMNDIFAAFMDCTRRTTNASRKAFAQAVMQHYPQDSKYLFALLDDRPVRDMVLKSLDLNEVFA